MTRPIGYVVEHDCPPAEQGGQKHADYGNDNAVPPRNFDFFLVWRSSEAKKILEQAQKKFRIELPEVYCKIVGHFKKVLGNYYGYVGSQDTAFGDDAINDRIREFVEYLLENKFKLWRWG